MGDEKNKIKGLIDQVRSQVKLADDALEAALQERENILAIPITRDEVKDNLAQAVDASAKKFEKTLRSLVYGRARKRDAFGVNRTPEVVRSPGNYSQLNIEAINYFLGDIIKLKVNGFIDELDYFGVADGVNDEEYQQLIDDINNKIDGLKLARDAISGELQSILK